MRWQTKTIPRVKTNFVVFLSVEFNFISKLDNLNDIIFIQLYKMSKTDYLKAIQNFVLYWCKLYIYYKQRSQ